MPLLKEADKIKNAVDLALLRKPLQTKQKLNKP